MFPTSLDHTRAESPLKFEIVTQPAAEPVTYEQLDEWCKFPGFDDRALTMSLETVGRMYVEQRTRYTLINTTFNLWLDFFPPTIILPARPVQQVNFIQYTDQQNNLQTLNPSQYLVDTKGPRPVIIPPLGTFFPIARVQYPNAVQVNFTAGFGTTAAAVPLPFQLLIMQWVATNYVQREAVIAGKSTAIVPHTFDALMSLNKAWEV